MQTCEVHGGAKTPVVVFAYNRPSHLERCLNSLELNTHAGDSHVFVFVDGPKDGEDRGPVNDCLEVCRRSWNFASLTVEASPTNMGLRNSVLSGVGQVLQKYPRVVVVEDDLVLAEDFLCFCLRGLEEYEDCEMVQAIAGFAYGRRHFSRKAYFLPMAESWGWATWRTRWEVADSHLLEALVFRRYGFWRELVLEAGNFRSMTFLQMSGKLDSWALPWLFLGFGRGQLTLYPPSSLVANEGFEIGTHPIRKEKLRRLWSSGKFKSNLGRGIKFPTGVTVGASTYLALVRKLAGSRSRLFFSFLRVLSGYCKSIRKAAKETYL